MIRRYLTVIQDARGYPAPGDLPEDAPEGPSEPMMHMVVLATDYEQLEAEVQRLRAAVALIGEARGVLEQAS